MTACWGGWQAAAGTVLRVASRVVTPRQHVCTAPVLLPQAVATAESTQMKDGADKLVELLARLAKVCQVSTVGHSRAQQRPAM